MKPTDTEWSTPIVGSGEPDVVRLARLIRAYTPHDGRFELRIPGVHAIRVSRVNPELVHVLQPHRDDFSSSYAFHHG